MLVLAAGVYGAAEMLGRQVEIYCGTAGGVLLGAVGYGFSLRIAQRHRAITAQEAGRKDIWAWWVTGFLTRLVLLGVLTLVYGRLLPQGFLAAMLSTMAVYVVLLFWEAWWLYRILVNEAANRAAKEPHG